MNHWLKPLACALLAILFCSPNTLLQAQEQVKIDTFARTKIPVLVEPMKFSDDLPPGLVQRIQQVAYTILEQHWHFEVINHSSSENSGEIDPEYIFQLSLLPLIDNLSQNDTRDSTKAIVRTNYYLSSGVKLNLRVTNIVTGELKYSHEISSIQSARGRKFFNPPNMVFAYGATVDWRFGTKRYPFPKSPAAEAQILQDEKNSLLRKALDEFPDIWRQALVEIFPSPIHLTSVINGSAKKPKEVMIDAGQDFGIRKGYAMEVYTYKVYQALGEQFIREEKLGNFYPIEVNADSCRGRLIGGRRDVGDALARGEDLFVRFR